MACELVADIGGTHLRFAVCDDGQLVSDIEAFTPNLTLSSLTPETISQASQTGSRPVAGAATRRFSSILGAVAGDAALTFGARGGAYMGGGVVAL